mmetsp:Transcript_4690/g.8236  ORF Transcript_4690/g.8236 Transcript_4690/m.8236 type:complete len:414 (+) Transcript_4690:169-1410(+)
MAAAAAPKTAPAPGTIPIPPSPNFKRAEMPYCESVARQFVAQYYYVLSSWPENLHRFYTDASTLSHSVVGESTIHIQTQRAIHEKVTGLGLQGAVPQILSVDSQASLGGGVVVHTTGFLTLKGSKPRPFAQVFFLAQQEIGYYVLNDLFCWLQREETSNEVQEQPPPQVAQKKEQQTRKSDQTAESQQKAAATAVADKEDASVVNVPQPAAASQPPAAAEPANQVAAAPVVKQEKVVEMPSVADIDLDAPMTYAQRLKMAAAKRAPGAAASNEKNDDPTVAATSVNSGEEVERSAGQETVQADEVDSSSIFVRNLPSSITDEVLLAEFSKFGPVEGGVKGVSLKNVQKGNPYAFVHFQSPQVAASVLGAKIEIDGRQLEIAEKKPSIINRSKKMSNMGRGRGKKPGRGGRGGQ